MRAFIALLALISYASATILWARQAEPPECTIPCLNTNTNNISTGACGSEDLACLCRDSTYVQAVIDCLATVCADMEDVVTGLQYSTAFCGAAGVNEPPAGLTTPTAQLDPTATGSTTTPSETTTTTTTPNAASRIVNLQTSSFLVGALVVLATAMAF